MSESIREIIHAYSPRSSLPGASTPPSSWYINPRILELEQRAIFSHSWHLAGRSDQVRSPGQYLTFDIAGEPILVVRGNDSTLRGLENVCRHHAAAVMTKSEGKAENLRCPYHGWTYELTGALVHTPEFAGVANFDRSANGLVPVQTAHSWRDSITLALK